MSGPVPESASSVFRSRNTVRRRILRGVAAASGKASSSVRVAWLDGVAGVRVLFLSQVAAKRLALSCGVRAQVPESVLRGGMLQLLTFLCNNWFESRHHCLLLLPSFRSLSLVR